ncbi:MAG: serine/threonine protein kinase [Steroidobacteraceae bacterium]
MTEPIGDSARAAAAPDTAKDWLDALACGTCDEDVFLRAVQPLVQISSDAGWELLSLLDQYYRRGKIKPEVFRAIKSHFEGHLLGTSSDIEVSVPPAQKYGPFPAAALSSATTSVAVPAAVGAGSAVLAARGNRREIAVGDVLRGRYRIKGVLGRGDTGCVFEAVDEYLLDLPDVEQRLAIKVPHAVADRPELLDELRREFQRMQSLSHPNILRVHEYDRHGGIAFFTMEYLSGLSLSRVLSARHQIALQRPHAVAIIRAVGAALAHAHAHGVVHGDLNPENIFITDAGEVRVMDFGGAHEPHRASRIRDAASAEQKPAAALRYASCQLLEGGAAGTRDDLYAFACVVYLLLAGRHPFRDQTSLEARMLGMRPTRPAGLTGAQWRAQRMGLAFDRERRPADVEKWLIPFDGHSAAEGLPALLELLRVSTPKRSRWLRPSLAAGVAAMLAVGWGVWTNVDSITGAAAWLRQTRHRAADAESPAEQSTARSPPASAPARTTPPAPPTAASAPPAPPAAASAPPAAASAPPASKPSVRATAPVSAPRVQRSRIELSAAAVEVRPAESTAEVLVRRSGNVQGNASFHWWTESGTAKPGQDFMPVAPREESIGQGKGAVKLHIPLVSDSTRQQPKSFYVVISDPSDGATLGARTVTIVTIPPPQ